MMTKGRRWDIELMRILGTYFVIFNHTRMDGFLLFTSRAQGSITFWVDLFVSIFCKFAVPLFFMISGALFLNREVEPIKQLWKRRIQKMVLLLLLWSFLYYLLNICQNGLSFSLRDFVVDVYEGKCNYSFWYLYAYIAMLISLPFLQRLAKVLSNKEYGYLFTLYLFLVAVLPMAEYLIWQGRRGVEWHIKLDWICSKVFIFPLCGYFLEYRAKQFWNRKRLALLWLVNIITILISCGLTYYKIKITGICDEDNSQTFFSSFVLLNSTSIFVTCQYLFDRWNKKEKVEHGIRLVGSCTFGIYLLHIFLMSTPLSGLTGYFHNQLHIGSLLSAFLYCFIVFLMGFGITFILKKTQLKRLVS